MRPLDLDKEPAIAVGFRDSSPSLRFGFRGGSQPPRGLTSPALDSAAATPTVRPFSVAGWRYAADPSARLQNSATSAADRATQGCGFSTGRAAQPVIRAGFEDLCRSVGCFPHRAARFRRTALGSLRPHVTIAVHLAPPPPGGLRGIEPSTMPSSAPAMRARGSTPEFGKHMNSAPASTQPAPIQFAELSRPSCVRAGFQA